MIVVVFAAHPDDDVIGCGGSIALHSQAGDDVKIVYLTSGNAGSLNFSSKEEIGATREKEADLAAHALGAKETIFLRHEDGYLAYGKDTLVEITTLIRKLKPDIVYTPHQKDGHPDHRAVFSIVAEAIDRASGSTFPECPGDPWGVKNFLCYEIWTPLQNVQFSRDITSVIDKKVQAIKLHESQVSRRAYDEGAKALNYYRGFQTGKGDYVECFELMQVAEL